MKRFNLMEKMVSEEGKELQEMSLTEMDEYWEKAKQILRSKGQES